VSQLASTVFTAGCVYGLVQHYGSASCSDSIYEFRMALRKRKQKWFSKT